MFHTHLVLLILIGVLCSTIISNPYSHLQCGRREFWRPCKKCQRFCGAAPRTVYTYCSKVCEAKCHCRRKFVRESPSGGCVHHSKCGKDFINQTIINKIMS